MALQKEPLDLLDMQPLGDQQHKRLASGIITKALHLSFLSTKSVRRLARGKYSTSAATRLGCDAFRLDDKVLVLVKKSIIMVDGAISVISRASAWVTILPYLAYVNTTISSLCLSLSIGT